MKVFLATVAILSGISLLPLILLSFWNTSQLFNYLKENHPTAWQQLGGPKVGIGIEHNVDSPPIRYFTTKKFLDIPDPELHAVGFSARRALYWASSAFVTFIVSTMSFVTGGQMGWL